MSSEIKLSELASHAEAIICTLKGETQTSARLTDLGFYPGAITTPLFTAVCGEPTAYLVQNAVIALRRSEAEKIYVRPL